MDRWAHGGSTGYPVCYRCPTRNSPESETTLDVKNEDRIRETREAVRPNVTMPCPEQAPFATQDPYNIKIAARCKKTLRVGGKRLTLFLVSHVGLTCLVISYSLLGAVIFSKLEGPNEKRATEEITKTRKDYVRIIWNITKEFNVLRELNWTLLVEKEVMDFQRKIYLAVKEKGWDGQSDVAKGERQWSFVGSLLYSVTVITTIGYGNIAPKTGYGRLMTILYALIGIPLTLLCLANLGSFLAKCFRAFYDKFLCYLCRWRSQRLADAKKGTPHKFVTDTIVLNNFEAPAPPPRPTPMSRNMFTQDVE
ncbi:hypothetical protein ScPMuIL_005339 [Solemya velum]